MENTPVKPQTVTQTNNIVSRTTQSSATLQRSSGGYGAAERIVHRHDVITVILKVTQITALAANTGSPQVFGVFRNRP